MSDRHSIDVSLSEIAAHSGLNSALVKYYFGNKNGLLLALVEREAAAALPGFQGAAAPGFAADREAAPPHRRHHQQFFPHAVSQSPAALVARRAQVAQRAAGSAHLRAAGHGAAARVARGRHAHRRVQASGSGAVLRQRARCVRSLVQRALRACARSRAALVSTTRSASATSHTCATSSFTACACRSRPRAQQRSRR